MFDLKLQSFIFVECPNLSNRLVSRRVKQETGRKFVAILCVPAISSLNSKKTSYTTKPDLCQALKKSYLERPIKPPVRSFIEIINNFV